MLVLRRGEPARSAEDLVMGAKVSAKQLRELHIRVVKPGLKASQHFPCEQGKIQGKPKKGAAPGAFLVPKQAENSIISGKNFPAGANREFAGGNREGSREANWGEQGIRSPSTRDRDRLFSQNTCRCSWRPKRPRMTPRIGQLFLGRLFFRRRPGPPPFSSMN
jgi:hypothetical protein